MGVESRRVLIADSLAGSLAYSLVGIALPQTCEQSLRSACPKAKLYDHAASCLELH